MKNTLTDLNNHLFAQIERLSDEDIKGEGLIEELARAKGVSGVARDIIANAALTLRAAETIRDYNGRGDITLPHFLAEVQRGSSDGRDDF